MAPSLTCDRMHAALNEPGRPVLATCLLVLAGFLLSGCRAADTEPEAVVALPPAVALQPAPRQERLRAQLDLAEGYLEIGELARARSALDRALEIDSADWEVHDLFGRIYQQQGEAELAERHFRLALRDDPDSARVRNDYGVFLYQQERYAEAVRELNRAVADPDSAQRPIAFQNLGLANLAIDARTDARNAFARAVMLDERMSRALIELAELAYEDEDFAQSATYYRRYRNVTQRQSARSLWLGIRLARIAEDADAEASYALQLRNLYPYSGEYENYREMQADG